MKNDRFDRRAFLKTAVAGSAAAATVSLPRAAEAQQGVPSQGYQLPLTPAELYRTGIAAANAFCVKTYGKSFDKISESQREEFLLGLRAGKVVFENGPPARVFFATLYQNVMEGMFADPIYGGNRNKAGWKMIGFPGVIAVHYQNVEKYRDRKYSVDPVGISDMS